MAHWDLQNGWIQFAFGNEQDRYYLPGLIQVDMRRYLLYSLKKSGYEAVFFWNEVDGRNEIGFMDGTSAAYYEEIKPRGLFKKLFGAETGSCIDEYRWTSLRVSSDGMEEIFYNISDGAKRAALIVPMAVFDSFFDGTARRNKLIKYFGRAKSSDSIVLITAGIRAEDSCTYLTRKDGVLGQLFGDIRKAKEAKLNSNIYELMKKKLGESCVYLNAVEAELLGGVVSYCTLFDESCDIPADGQVIEKIVYVLERYYHSRAFRDAIPLALLDNPKREYKLIHRSLKDPKVCAVILDWIDIYGEDVSADRFGDRLRREYPDDDIDAYIYSDSFLLRRWRQLTLPVGIAADKRNYFASFMKDLGAQLEIIVYRGDETIDSQSLDACIDQLEKSLDTSDGDTFGHGLDGMAYLLDSYYEQSEDRTKIWELYKTIFRLSEDICMYDKSKEEYHRQILAYEKELREIFARLDEIKERVARYGDQDGEEDILKQRAVRADDEIQLLNGLIKLNQSQRFNASKAISETKQAISLVTGGGQVDVQNVLEQAMELQQKDLQKSIYTMKEIQDVLQRI